MKQFSTVNELAKAYQEKYNASYNNDPQKSFSISDVYNVCVELKMKASMNYLFGVNSFAYVVDGFGYVLTEDRKKREI